MSTESNDRIAPAGTMGEEPALDPREALRIIDEQRSHLVDDADDLGLRAVVSDSPLARSEAHAAGGHAAAIEGARVHVVDEISRLERRQDTLLDRFTAG